MCFASGDITEKGYTKKKARLEEKFSEVDTSKEGAESISVKQLHKDPIAISKVLEKPKEAYHKAILEVFGKTKSAASAKAGFNPSAVGEKFDVGSAAKKGKSLSRGRKVTVVCLNEPSMPHGKKRRELEKAGKIKDIILHRTISDKEDCKN